MSQLGASDRHDTNLTAVLFPDGTDRRQGARIPISAPVRVGPPGGLPEAAVSAADLSAGGMFIDADRPVRVGARFSAEIPLSGGEKIYVAEAEVTYNRDRARGAGFGVRFVKMDDEARDALTRAVNASAEHAVAVPSAIGSVHSRLDTTEVIRAARARRAAAVSELPTLVPSRPPHPMEVSELDLDVSRYPEPAILDSCIEVGSILESEVDPMVIPVHSDEPTRSRFDLAEVVRGARHRVVERARTLPNVWTGVAAIGAGALCVAVVLTVWTGSRAEAVETAEPRVERGVSAVTHQVLVGSVDPDALRETSPVAPVAAFASDDRPKTKPLPPLVLVEEPEAPKVAVEDEAEELEALEVEARPARVEPARVEPKPAVKPAPPAPKAAPEPKPEGAAGAMSAKARAILGQSVDTLRVGGLDSGARVLKTHVLRAPDRFVIDLVGQTGAPQVPDGSGHVKGVRWGRHPEYVRLVVDVSAPLEMGHVTTENGRMTVRLNYK